MLCAGALSAIGAQLRCIDAAREAARLVARGDAGSVDGGFRSLAPPGAVLRLRREGGFVFATVSIAVPLLPGITVRSDAVAAAEPIA